MAAKKTTDSLSARQTPKGLAERLTEHAKTIRNPAAAAGMGDEAARILAEWSVGIAEVIQHTKEDDTRARLSKLLEG